MFIFILVIIIAAYTSPITGLLAAFIAGLMIDIWQGDAIGLSSLIFVSVAGILNLYKRKFNPEHSIFLIPFTIIAAILYQLYTLGWQYDQQEILRTVLYSAGILVGILLILRLWVHRFGKKDQLP